MQHGAMSYEDRELVWDAALACEFIPVEYVVRENISIHLYTGQPETEYGPEIEGGHYWNPLDPKTCHHFDILRALPFDIKIDRFQGSYSIAISIDKVTEGSARMYQDAEDFDRLFCRTLVRSAAEFYRRKMK